MKPSKLFGTLLLIIAAVLGFFTIVDFSWKVPALNLAFLLGYLMTGVAGLFDILAATGNLPDAVKRNF